MPSLHVHAPGIDSPAAGGPPPLLAPPLGTGAPPTKPALRPKTPAPVMDSSLVAAKTAYITSALQELAAGRSASFCELQGALEQLTSGNGARQGNDWARSASLREWLAALVQTAGLLTRDTAGIVNNVLQVAWFVEPRDIVELYGRLVETLASVRSDHVGGIVEALVQRLQWGGVCGALQTVYDSTSASDNGVQVAPLLVEGNLVADATRICNEVHRLLARVLEIAPASVSPLQVHAMRFLPHKSRPTFEHVWYLRNILRIIQYAPMLRPALLGGIVARLMQMDVELVHRQGDGEDADDSASEADSSAAPTPRSSTPVSVASLPAVQGSQTVLLSDSEDEGALAVAAAEPTVAYCRARLDSTLRLLLEWTGEHARDASLFETYIHIFDQVILPTHQSRYVQYVLFYGASLDTPALPDRFLGYLMGMVLDLSKAQVFRFRAAMYLGGFVARFQDLDRQSVRDCFHVLVRWAVQYVEEVLASARAQRRLRQQQQERRRRGGVWAAPLGRQMVQSTPSLLPSQGAAAPARHLANHSVDMHAMGESAEADGSVASLVAPCNRKYAVFYGVAQALMYMFLFRWRDLCLSEAELQQQQQPSPAASPPPARLERPGLGTRFSNQRAFVDGEQSESSEDEDEPLPDAAPANVPDRRAFSDSAPASPGYVGFAAPSGGRSRRLVATRAGGQSPYRFYSDDVEPLRAVVTCPLQPLWMCSAPVVDEFCKVMLDLELMYLFHHTREASGATARAHADDAFFPFEPYDLPQTAGLFAPLYRGYSPVGAAGGRCGAALGSGSPGEAVSDDGGESALDDDDWGEAPLREMQRILAGPYASGSG